MAAAAALTNANELCAEAKLLAENEHKPRAAALAVIGLEEFAKAVAYTLAAIFPEQSVDIRQRLLKHDVKHWIADTFEGAQIEIEEWPRVVFQDTGSWPPSEEVLLHVFIRLSKSEWGSFVPTADSAKAAAESTDLQKAMDKEIGKVKIQKEASLTTPFIKDACPSPNSVDTRLSHSRPRLILSRGVIAEG